MSPRQWLFPLTTSRQRLSFKKDANIVPWSILRSRINTEDNLADPEVIHYSKPFLIAKLENIEITTIHDEPIRSIRDI